MLLQFISSLFFLMFLDSLDIRLISKESFSRAIIGCLPELRMKPVHVQEKNQGKAGVDLLKKSQCRDGLNALYKLASGNSPEAIILREQLYEVCTSLKSPIVL